MPSRAFIDTQVAFWLAKGDPRITALTLRQINSSSETAISALSIAELEIKAGIGKLALPRDLGSLFKDQGIKIEPFDELAAAALARFPSLVRHDSFDRMILAQASSRPNTSFFTADRVLAELKFDWIIDCS